MASSKWQSPARQWFTEHASALAAFAIEARVRGVALRVGGHVRIFQHTEREVTGDVSDGGRQIVSYSWDPVRLALELQCSCQGRPPYGTPCAHSWALLLEAAVRGMVSKAELPGWFVVTFNGLPIDFGFVDGVGGVRGLDGLDDDDDGFLRRPSPSRSLMRQVVSIAPGGPLPTPDNSVVPSAEPRFTLEGLLLPSRNRGLQGYTPPTLICALLVPGPANESQGVWGERVAEEDVHISVVGVMPDGRTVPVSPELGIYSSNLDPIAAELLVRALRHSSWEPRSPDLYPSRPLRAVEPPRPVRLPRDEAAPFLERLLRAGRLYHTSADGSTEPLGWAGDGGAELRVLVALSGTRYVLDGKLSVAGRELPRTSWSAVYTAGLVMAGGDAVVLSRGAAAWAAFFSEAANESLSIGADELESFLDRFHSLEDAPTLVLPAGLRFAEVTVPVAPCLDIGAPDGASMGLPVTVWARYGEREVSLREWERHRYAHDLVNRIRHPRDHQGEAELLTTLEALGVRVVRDYGPIGGGVQVHRLGRKRVPEVAQKLLEAGWSVSVERKRYSRVRAFHLRAASGIDWLELSGTVELDDCEVPLGELIRALRRRNRDGSFVELESGPTAVLPDAWLQRLEQLAALGIAKGQNASVEGVSLARAHVGAALAVLDSADSSAEDHDFAELRRKLERGRLPEAKCAPTGFRGTLRDYQMHGLGWLEWLREVGFGGCLADDMGLGKTVQVLALLVGTKRSKRPSLVLAPRSVVHNWVDEATRFAPALVAQAHLGAGRATEPAQFRKYHLIVTTYATLMRDLELFQSVTFDCLVLDEAQAVKNSEGQAARAVRTLKARQRLALTGTPIENHLGELWSLLDFLNPGFGKRIPATGAQLSDSEQQLVRALIRPFILRRTKGQVATDLPDRVEQTVKVELSPAERRRYRELHGHFRQEYSEAVERLGVHRSTPQLLTGLLRLRQAACHQGLIDPKRRTHRSSKLDFLLERLAELAEEGAKCLVFSQFTSHLDIVEGHLTKAGIHHVRLDGSTRDRASRVRSFQEDSSVAVFLLSLKAGGTGLNLTAAEYVFILDPWWNPAVEAQAIDRAHRIGQTSKVIAYRLIASDTIEEKVAELQARKRALVDSVFGDDSAFLGKLTRDELLSLLD